MRIVHTADWHLGRLLHGVHLTEDQAYLLDQFVHFVRDAEPDVVIVAGDVYDRAVPPSAAVKLLDDTLRRLVVGLEVPVVMISGNHDSPDRLHFGASVFRKQGLHVSGRAHADVARVTLHDEHGPVHLFLFPYCEPAEMRSLVPDEAVRCHDDVLRVQSELALRKHPDDARSIAVAHVFAQGGELADSERPLSIGGAETVSTDRFAGFDYVALGHLHRQQHVEHPHIQYSGSLMKYSFNEVTHTKSVNLVDLDAAGTCRVEQVPLVPRRDLRRVEGTLDEVLGGPGAGESHDDYVWVTLREQGPVLGAMSRIREVYPNAMHVERPRQVVESTLRGLEADGHRKSDAEIFDVFFSHVTGEEALSGRQREIVTDAIDAIHADERSA